MKDKGGEPQESQISVKRKCRSGSGPLPRILRDAEMDRAKTAQRPRGERCAPDATPSLKPVARLGDVVGEHEEQAADLQNPRDDESRRWTWVPVKKQGRRQEGPRRLEVAKTREVKSSKEEK